MNIIRDLYAEIEPVIPAPEAVIITGMRRVGKTTLLKHILNQLPSNNKLYLDLENPLNRRIFEEDDYEAIYSSFINLGLDPKTRGCLFLDEIQFVRNIPSVVKYLIDHHRIKFFLGGSASFYLKNLFTESLAGRKYIFELFPLNFREFMRFKAPKLVLPSVDEKISRAIFAKFNRYYEEFIHYGGFPGVVLKDSEQEKRMMLEDVFTSYFQLEVVQLSDFRKTDIVRDLMLLLMERVGSKLDVQKLSSELGLSRLTVQAYISFLEQTYFIHLIKPFSRNRDFEIRSTPKIYLCDTGLLNRFARISEGALFENAVFLALKQKGEVNYYQKKSGVEIDFVLDKRHAYEVKNQPSPREENRLGLLAKELKLKMHHMVARKYTELPGAIYGSNL